MGKTIVILRPQYFPWAGVFEQIRLADIYVHHDDVQFPQRRSPYVTILALIANVGDGWRILPSTTAKQDMHDPADHAAIINPRLAPRVGRKMPPKPFELLVVEPEIISIPQRSPFGGRELRFARDGNPVYGSHP
jgi:hypothetical protein